MNSAASELHAQSGAPITNILHANGSEFRLQFGVSAFALTHRLVESGLFTVPRLERAAEYWMKLGRNDRFVISGVQPNISGKFADMLGKERIAGAIEALAVSNSWMKISNISAVDSAYMNLTRAVLRDIEKLSCRPILSQVTWCQMTVFMASPNVVTPYHFDHEQNFLCQITGEKDVCLFDPNDRELLTDAEIERFYSGVVDSANYREELQPRGKIFRLKPGVAVHFPPLAPHWVKNGPGVSISVSMNFCMRDIDRRAHIYQVNHHLRKFGLHHPTPPGKSVLRDGFKAGCVQLFSVSNPKSYREAVFSGLDRLHSIYRIARIGRQKH